MIKPTFADYLLAKRSVDDRALNRSVFAGVRPFLTGGPDRPARVLELGAGVGTMLERLADWRALENTEYTAVDSDLDLVRLARARMASRPGNGLAGGESNGGGHQASSAAGGLSVRYINKDIFEFLHDQGSQDRFDVVLAHAVLDLLDLDSVLTTIANTLAPGGQMYASVNFDGLTIFEPTLDRELDRMVMEAYHRTMDERLAAGKPSGHSQTGRKLLWALPAHGFEIVSAGSSDWVIYPHPDGYAADDRLILEWMLGTIRAALQGTSSVSRADLDSWEHHRRVQLRDQELIFIAHQLDVHARYAA